MFELYTERARRTLLVARHEAEQSGAATIEAEHLLLALVQEGKGMTSRLFTAANLTLDSVRREISGRVAVRETRSTSGELPFSVEVKRVLQFTAVEAERWQHNYIGTEHLLLGLLCEDGSVAAAILTDAGLSLDHVREAMSVLLDRPRPDGP